MFICKFSVKKKCFVRRGMKKPGDLPVRRYVARIIDINGYLAPFWGANLNDKIGVTELNIILLNSMPNSWSRQACAQGFDFEYMTFKKSVNMFECMEIDESIYKGVVEPYYK